MDNKKMTKRTLIIVAIFVGVIILFQSFYIVFENEYVAVIRFDRINYIQEFAGIHLRIPFIEDVRSYPKHVMSYTMKESEVFTVDRKAMSADNFVLWRITNPLIFFQTLGDIQTAQERINRIVQSELRRLVGNMQQDDIIALRSLVEATLNDIDETTDDFDLLFDRENIDDAARRQLNSDLVTEVIRIVDENNYGIKIIDVKIKRFDLPAENELHVYNRMIAERNRMAERYRAGGIRDANILRAEVDRDAGIVISNAEAEAEIIKAEGEAEYMRILADAFNSDDKRDFYLFIRSLDALKTSLGGEDKTVILDRNSDLARTLMRP